MRGVDVQQEGAKQEDTSSPDAQTSGAPSPAAARDGAAPSEPSKAAAGDGAGEPEAAAKADATPMTYNELNDQEAYVLLRKGTERAGTGEYTDLKDDGLYICRQCNAPLYRSADKFHSGCGWPSFFQEVEPDAVRTLTDTSHGMTRTEMRCAGCDGHLGHIFRDAPHMPTGLRHCVNGYALVFVPEGADPAAVIRDHREDREQGQ